MRITYNDIKKSCDVVNETLAEKNSSKRLSVYTGNNRYYLGYGTPEQVKRNALQDSLISGDTPRVVWNYLRAFQKGIEFVTELYL